MALSLTYHGKSFRLSISSIVCLVPFIYWTLFLGVSCGFLLSIFSCVISGDICVDLIVLMDRAVTNQQTFQIVPLQTSGITPLSTLEVPLYVLDSALFSYSVFLPPSFLPKVNLKSTGTRLLRLVTSCLIFLGNAVPD